MSCCLQLTDRTPAGVSCFVCARRETQVCAAHCCKMDLWPPHVTSDSIITRELLGFALRNLFLLMEFLPLETNSLCPQILFKFKLKQRICISPLCTVYLLSKVPILIYVQDLEGVGRGKLLGLSCHHCSNPVPRT